MVDWLDSIMDRNLTLGVARYPDVSHDVRHNVRNDLRGITGV